MTDTQRQDLISTAVTLIPTNISTNTTVVSNDLYFLHDQLGDYALKFAKYTTNTSYHTFKISGDFDIGSGLFGSGSFQFSGYDSAELSVDGNVQVFGLTGGAGSSNNDGASLNGGLKVGVIETSSSTDANGNDAFGASVNLQAVSFGMEYHKTDGQITGFMSEAGPSLGKFAGASFGVGKQYVDVAFDLKSQRFANPEIGGFLSDVDDIFSELKINFPSIAISQDQFYQRISANLKYGDMLDNYNEIEATGIVVHEILNGSDVSQLGEYSNVSDISQLIQDKKTLLQSEGEDQAFTGNYIDIDLSEQPIEEDSSIEPKQFTDEEIKEILLDSVEAELEENKISNSREMPIQFENSDGTTEEIIFNPTARKINQFESDFSNALANGTVLSQITNSILNADGSTSNISTVILQDSDGTIYEIQKNEISPSGTPAANGFLGTELVRHFAPDGTTLIETKQNTLFLRDGRIFETKEFQNDPDDNWSISQNLYDQNGALLDDGPLFVVPSKDMLQAFQLVGSTVGGFLADKFAEGDFYKGIVYDAVIQTIQTHFGTFSAYLLAGGELEAAVQAGLGTQIVGQQTAVITPEFMDTFYTKLNVATAQAVSNLIVGEVGDALGIDDGIGGEVFNVAGNFITTGLISEGIDIVIKDLPTGVFTGLATGTLNFSSPYYNPNLPGGGIADGQIGPPAPNTTVGEFVGLQIANALAAYAGNRLAGEVIEPENEIAAVFGAAGSALATGIATGALLAGNSIAAIFTGIGWAGGPIGAAIGAFVGNVAGTVLGNLFGGDDEEPYAVAFIESDIVNAEYVVDFTRAGDGGDKQIALSMASAAMEAANAIIETTQGNFRRSTHEELRIGYEGSRYFVRADGQIHNFQTSGDAIKFAALQLLKGADIVGGHAIAMRAWYNSEAETIEQFQEDIMVAEAFQVYLLNPTAVLALMMDQPESEAAQEWAVILERAAELELHLPHEKDIDGGWGELLAARGDLNPNSIPQIDNGNIVLTDADTGEETLVEYVIGPGYEIVRTSGTDGADNFHLQIDGAAISYTDAGPGDDTFVGHDGNDIFIGGDGDDTANGGAGDDWLIGNGGNDTLYGEVGDDLLFGGDGDDYLSGGEGVDTILGGRGNDTIMGNEHADFLYGGEGDDVIYGNEGLDDQIFGEEGDDELHGQENDILDGGVGDDTYHIDSEATAYIERGDGHDSVYIYGNYNKIKFAPNIAPGEITAEKVGNDLIFHVDGEDQSITVKDAYSLGQNQLPELYFISTNYNDSNREYKYNKYTVYFSSRYDIHNNDDSNPMVLRIGDYGSADSIIGDTINIYDVTDNYQDSYYSGYGVTVSAGTDADSTLDNNDDYELFFYGNGGEDFIGLSDNNDLGVGGTGDDRLFGRGGDDELYGGADSDLIDGGEGKDSLFGGQGNDFIDGGEGNDLIYGGEGNDSIIASSGQDVINGNIGDDVIFAGDGIDSAHGGDGHDFIVGGNGNDQLSGNADDDLIYGGEGNDFISGGDGDDTLFGEQGNDEINGDNGEDVAVYKSSYSNYDITFENNYLKITDASNEEGEDRLYDVEFVEFSDGLYEVSYENFTLLLHSIATIGTLAAEIISGTVSSDTIFASNGDDTIYGGDGNDHLHGEDGNDSLYGEAGNNRLYGGDGDDLYIISQGKNIVSDTSGNDTLYLNTTNDIHDLYIQSVGTDYFIKDIETDVAVIAINQTDQGNKIENLRLSDGATVKLNTHENWIYDLNKTNSVSGDNDVNTILGGEGDDFISGKNGDDELFGGDGDDIIYGNQDNDLVHGGEGDDRLYGSAGEDIVYGGIGEDTVRGDGGNDILHGGDDDDALQGGANDDVLYGGAGEDHINGNGNNDILYGGDGFDTLIGGSGSDTFVFEADSAFNDVDQVNDFNISQNDVIDISDLLTAYDPVTDALTDFVEITQVGSHSYLAIDMDGAANGQNFEQIAWLKNERNITDEDQLVTNGNLIVS